MESLEKERTETERARKEKEEAKESRKKEVEERRNTIETKRKERRGKEADKFLNSLDIQVPPADDRSANVMRKKPSVFYDQV